MTDQLGFFSWPSIVSSVCWLHFTNLFCFSDLLLTEFEGSQFRELQGIEWVWEYFWGVKSIVYFTDWHIPVNQALLGVLGLAVVMSLVYRILRKEWIKKSDSFLLISIIFTFMFFRAPWSFGPGDG